MTATGGVVFSSDERYGFRQSKAGVVARTWAIAAKQSLAEVTSIEDRRDLYI
jgi:hypothetical protein